MNTKKSPIKVSILYRVIQHWRAPVFRKVSEAEGYKVNLFYGPDFEDFKVASTKKLDGLNASKLNSILLKLNSANGGVAMPVSTTLFFNLIKTNPSIVVSEGASNLANALQGFLYAKLFRKKFIWWSLGKLKNYGYDVKRKRVDFLVKYIERNADGIISYSSVGKEYFESIGVPSEKIFVAVNVVDTDTRLAILEKYLAEKKNEQGNQERRGLKVLYVGAVTKEKKLDLLLKGFKLLESKYNDVQLDIVGSGPYLNETKQQSAELGIKNVTFHGQVVDNVHKFFLESDVFVLPGLGGLAVSEAMVYGLPVIVSIGDGCEVDLVDETNGFRNPDLNEVNISEYLEYLYLNPDKLQEMKQNSINKIRNKYNISAYVGKILESFNYVCQN